MSESIKSGNVILRDVRAPDSVTPGQPMDLEAEVSNGALAIGPFDPDRCGNAPVGYKLRVVFVAPDGTEYPTDWRCHGTTEVGTADYTYQKTVEAPDSGGTYWANAYVEMYGSGKTTGRVSESVVVSEDAPEQPDAPGEQPDDGTDWTPGDGGSNGSDPLDLGFSRQATLALIVVAMLAVAWTADSATGVID